MLTILPSMVWMSVPQPTVGQTLGVTLAFLIRSSWARATTGPRFTPGADKTSQCATAGRANRESEKVTFGNFREDSLCHRQRNFTLFDSGAEK
jgi:hypothetical protein